MGGVYLITYALQLYITECTFESRVKSPHDDGVCVLYNSKLNQDNERSLQASLMITQAQVLG